MGTLTVRLPPPLQAKLEVLAARRRQPKSELVREAIERLVDEEQVQVSVYDLVKDLVGSFRSERPLYQSEAHEGIRRMRSGAIAHLVST